jgi:RNA polymerase sigma factor (TIGR02999 family)
MVEGPGAAITRLLIAWKDGNPAALDQLTPLVYEELHRVASVYLKQERPGHLLQPTALVHEAWLQLKGSSSVNWESRKHFLGIAARLMRQILVQHARSELALKRGGGARPQPLDTVVDLGSSSSRELVALDDALAELASHDERKSRVVELHYFGGLQVAEIASLLEVSEATVNRDLRMARAWLRTRVI